MYRPGQKLRAGAFLFIALALLLFITSQSATALVSDSWTVENLAPTSSAVTANTVKVASTFTPATPGDYLILAFADLNETNAAGAARAGLLIDGKYAASAIYYPKSNTNWHGFVAMKVVSLDATSHTVQIVFNTSSTSYRAWMKNARIIVMRLDGTQQYGNSNPATLCTNQYVVKAQTGSFDVATTQDYILIGTAMLGGASTSYLGYVNMNDGATIFAEHVSAPTNAAGNLTVAFMEKVSLTAGSHNIALSAKGQSGTASRAAKVSSLNIFAIPVSAFSSVEYAEDQTVTSPDTAGMWLDKASATFTTDAANYTVLGAMIYNAASINNNYGAGMRIGSADFTTNTYNVTNMNTADRYASISGAQGLLTAGSHTASIQMWGALTTSTFSSGSILALRTAAQTISVADASGAEGGKITVAVTRSTTIGDDTSFSYTTADGNATAEANYTTTSGTATFAEGNNTYYIDVPVSDNSIYEGNRFFFVNITATAGCTVADADAIATITENEPTPVVSVASSTYLVDESVVGGKVTVALTSSQAAAAGVVKVNYATNAGTAASPANYTSTSGTATFEEGNTTYYIDIPILDPNVFESINRFFFLNLTVPKNCTIGTAFTTITIVETDAASTPTVTTTNAYMTVAENTPGKIVIPLTRSSKTGAVSVNYYCTPFTATAGNNYTAVTGTASYANNNFTTYVDVPILDNNVYDNSVIFFFNLTSPTVGCDIGAQDGTVITITENDAVPTVQFQTGYYDVNENAASLTLTLTKTGLSNLPCSVNYATADFKAVAGKNYTANSSTTITIPAGETSKTFTVCPIDNNLYDAPRAFFVNITGPSGCTLGTPAGAVVNVLETDSAPVVSLASATYSAVESAGKVTVSLTRSGTQPVWGSSIAYATANGNATQPANYTSTSGTATFPADNGTYYIDVPLIDGNVYETFNRFFYLNITEPTTNCTIGSQTYAEITILEDDTLPVTKPVTNFTSSRPIEFTTPFTVQFWDNTTSDEPLTRWEWQWGDGTANGTSQNPSHTYTIPGAYSVNLTVWNAGGSNSFQRATWIRANAPGLVLWFNWTTPGETELLAVDESGKALNMTLTKPGSAYTSIIKTPSGATARQFWSAPNYVYGTRSGGMSRELNLTNSATFEVIVNATKTGWHSILQKQVNPVDGWWFGIDSNGNSDFYYYKGGVQTKFQDEAYPYTLFNRTVHLTITMNQTDVVTYINGTMTQAWHGNYMIAVPPLTSATTRLGDNTANALNGTLYYLKVYNYDLTAAEVQTAYADNSWRMQQPNVTIASTTYKVNEDAGKVVVALKRDLIAGTPSVDYATANGNATQPANYTSTSGTATFADGNDTYYIDVPVVDEDVYENNKFFYLNISNPQSCALFTNKSTTITINETDTPPAKPASLFTANVTIGMVPLTVGFTDQSTGATVDGWQWQFGDGSSNVTTQNAEHTFTAAGVYKVNLTAYNGATAGTTAQTTITVYDQVRFIYTVFNFDEDVGTAYVNVTKLGPSTGSITVNYTTTDGTAINGVDYETATGSLTFGPDEVYKTFPVTIHNRAGYNDANKYFYVNLTSGNPSVVPVRPELRYRWFWIQPWFNTVADASDYVNDTMQTAHDLGYNGAVINMHGFMLMSASEYSGATVQAAVMNFRAKAAELGMELYISSFVEGDALSAVKWPALVEGIPVRNQSWQVSGSTATAVETQHISNGGFESGLAGWTPWTGINAVIDNTVYHTGGSSLHLNNMNNFWISEGQNISVQKWHLYNLTFWAKTTSIDPVRCYVLPMNNSSRYIYPPKTWASQTKDWTEYHIIFNSLDNDQIRIVLYGQKGTGGDLWFDDVSVQDIGLYNLIKRDNEPVVLTNTLGNVTYIEGIDYSRLQNDVAADIGYYASPSWNTPQTITLLPGSRIQNGQEILASYYTPPITYGRFYWSLTDPAAKQAEREVANTVANWTQADGYFLGYDEISLGGYDEYGGTQGERLASAVQYVTQTLNSIDPSKPVFVWNDMFDPYMNAVDNYHLTNGTFGNSWQGVRDDVTIVNWNCGIGAYYLNATMVNNSLSFFKGKNPQILAGYYDDANGGTQIKNWLDWADIRDATISGVLYTTWISWQNNGDYSQLAIFAENAWGSEANVTGRPNATVYIMNVDPAPIKPVTDFSAMFHGGAAGTPVQFWSNATNATGYEWSWGDGTANGTDANPTHVYVNPGVYTVTLTTTNVNGSDTLQRKNYIAEYEPVYIPTANFTMNIREFTVPMTVQFWDNSTNATSLIWQWGDGTPNSTEQNPTHAYTTSGNFTVNLTASNDDGSSTFSRSIRANAPALVLNLNWSSPAETENLAVDTSGKSHNMTVNHYGTAYTTIRTTPLGAVVRDFYNNPDYLTMTRGSADGLNLTNEGTIEAVVNATKNGWHAILQKQFYGTDGYWFGIDSNGNTDFYYYSNGVRTNFQDTDYPYSLFNRTTSITVTFNTTDVVVYTDGVMSKAWHGNYLLTTPNNTTTVVKVSDNNPNGLNGTLYYLKVYNYDLTAQEVASNYTANQWRIPVIPTSNFTTNVTSGVAPAAFQFTDTSTGFPTGWQWQWGDGTSNDTTQSPVHVYSSAGTYKVNLTASNANGTGNTYQSTVTVIAGTKPTSSFDTNKTSGLTPLCISFTGTSTGYPATYQWQWGDGSDNDTTQNAVHTYVTAGTYTVNMTASNVNGTGTTYQTEITAIAPTTPSSAFTANVTSGITPLCVAFTDASTGYQTAWQWQFGDGSSNVTTQNAVHTYEAAGTYKANLTASNANGTGTTYQVTITAIAGTTPTSSFTSNESQGVAPAAFQFTDTSTGFPTGWQWQWGDGTSNDTTQSPVHLYTLAGTYKVNLTASNANGTGNTAQTTITVIAPTLPTSSFTSNVTEGVAPLCVSFTDATTGYPTSWQWQWGDGESNSTTQNPVHAYAQAGTYKVNLTASNGNGTGTTFQSTITATAPVVPTADFHANATIGVGSLCVLFTDDSTGFPTAWQWQWGDGEANGTVQNPVHTYSTPGVYTVNLTASNTNGTNSYQRAAYITVLAPTVPSSDFSANVTYGIEPLCVGFSDQSTGYATSWQWDFNNDGVNDSSSQNPAYLYSAPGTYSVRQYAINANGSAYSVKDNYVTVIAKVYTSAAFHANVTSGIAPLCIGFTDDSTGSPTSWEWQWGDGQSNGTAQNPAHVYMNPGVYTVNLTVTNANGSSSYQHAAYIEVTGATIPTPDFSANVTKGVSPLCVKFTDASTGWPTSWQWDFNNDGVNDSTDQSPVYAYADAGVYSVKMYAINANGSAYTTKTSYIEVIAPTTPTPEFSANVTYGIEPLGVLFTDASTGYASSWQWDFNNDGVNDSTEQSPAYAYSTPGTYSVRMYAINANGSAFTVKNDYITVIAKIYPSANFHANVTSGTQPLCVGFTDDSTGSPTSWAWQWGDGQANGTTQNPVHSYAQAGTYSVNLTVGNTNGSNSFQRSAYITVVAAVLPTSSFTANETYGIEPLCVQFTDTTTGYPTSWAWQWGDGEANSTSQSPLHVYDAPGVYKVNMTASNGNGTGTTAQTTVTVIAKVYPVAGFSANQTTGVGTLCVLFSDASTGMTSWEWQFGDGSSNSTEQNPVHLYETPGVYTVNLTSINTNGTNTMQKVGYITVLTPSIPSSAFSANVTSGVQPLCVKFTETSTGLPTAWQWQFGDGSENNTEQHPVHTYTDAGTYKVNMTASNANGTSSITWQETITVIGKVYPSAEFHVNATSGMSPLCVLFTDDSTGVPTAWEWQWGDGEANGTAQNPVHTYLQAGTYTVNLTVTNGNGSSSIQKSGHITVTAPTLPTSSFTANETYGIEPLCVQFTDTTTGYPTSWQWQWGDGQANGTTQSPLHIYATPGVYKVNMTASNGNGTGTTAQTTVTVIAKVYPAAAFHANATIGVSTLYVLFSDDSTAATEWAWQFGDGSANSTEQNPVHLYETPGVYTVNLTSINTNGTNTMQKTGYITVIAATVPSADFSGNKTNGPIDLSIQFTDLSTGTPTGWEWDFGDSTSNATTKNPVHTYTVPGTYNVTLTATNANGTSSMKKIGYITVTNKGPIAEFTANQTSNYAPMMVQFTDLSSNNPSAWFWDFDNNGVNDSTEQNPTCLYSVAGDYTVKLYVTNDGGLGYETKVAYVHALPQAPTANFTVNATSGTVPFMVLFTDASEGGPTAWAWDFNSDGSNDSTEQNAVCLYTQPGTYAVTLYVSNAGGMNKTVKSGLIEASPGATSANFTANATVGGLPMCVQFNDTSGGFPTAWAWDFDNDGSNDSTEQNPICIYGAAGTYTVRLYVENSLGMDYIQKNNYISAGVIVASFACSRTVGPYPLTVHINDTTAGSPTSWTWDFGDGYSSTEQNPSHTYMENGTYVISLTTANDMFTDDANQTIRVTQQGGSGSVGVAMGGLALVVLVIAAGLFMKGRRE